jgi:hypothetical protein
MGGVRYGCARLPAGWVAPGVNDRLIFRFGVTLRSILSRFPKAAALDFEIGGCARACGSILNVRGVARPKFSTSGEGMVRELQMADQIPPRP